MVGVWIGFAFWLHVGMVVLTIYDSYGREANTVYWAAIVAISSLLGGLLYETLADRTPKSKTAS